MLRAWSSCDAVGKIQAGDVHAEAQQVAHGGFGVAGGADGADNFCPPTRLSLRSSTKAEWDWNQD